MVRFALIGTGSMGKKYAQMLAGGQVKGAALSAVVCRSEQSQQWARDVLVQDISTKEEAEKEVSSQIYIYADSDSLYTGIDVNGNAAPGADGFDVVLIVTPHKTHPQLAVQAFKAGKAVFCDKPAGVSVAQAELMNKAAVESGKLYAMMFHQRLYEKYIRIKNIMETGTLGTISRVILLNSRYYRTQFYHSSGAWRSSWNGEGGGALINQGQHIIDIWQWLFGMPESIYADIEFGKYNDFMVDDEATIMMKYPNHLTGVLMLTTGEGTWQERLEIIGTKGKIILEDDKLTSYIYDTDTREYGKNVRCNSREELKVKEAIEIFEKKPEPYVNMFENFVAAYNNNTALISPGTDGVNALEIVNAAYLSSWKHREVALPIDSDEYERELQMRIKEELQ